MRCRRLLASGHDFPLMKTVSLLFFLFFSPQLVVIYKPAPLGRVVWVWLGRQFGPQMNAVSCAESTDQGECQKRIAKECQRVHTTGILIENPHWKGFNYREEFNQIFESYYGNSFPLKNLSISQMSCLFMPINILLPKTFFPSRLSALLSQHTYVCTFAATLCPCGVAQDCCLSSLVSLKIAPVPTSAVQACLHPVCSPDFYFIFFHVFCLILFFFSVHFYFPDMCSRLRQQSVAQLWQIALNLAIKPARGPKCTRTTFFFIR